MLTADWREFFSVKVMVEPWVAVPVVFEFFWPALGPMDLREHRLRSQQNTTHQIQKQPMQSTEQAMPLPQASPRSPRMYPTAVFIASAASATDGCYALSSIQAAADKPAAGCSVVSIGRFTRVG